MCEKYRTLSIETDETIFYHQYRLTLDDVKKNIRHRKNRQYQWLLAEAYEKFEEFIEKIYAYLGKPELNFWPLNDYGNINLKQLEKCDFDWYVKQTKQRRGGAINTFKKIYADLKINSSCKNIPLMMLIIFIEKMRHIIVHNRGKTNSKEILIDLIFKESGISRSDDIYKAIKGAVSLYFEDKNNPATIFLLEIRSSDNILPCLYNIFDSLIDILLNASNIICNKCKSYVLEQIMAKHKETKLQMQRNDIIRQRIRRSRPINNIFSLRPWITH